MQKRTASLLLASGLVLILGSGCSIFGGSKPEAPPANKPAEVKENSGNVYDGGAYSAQHEVGDLTQRGGKMAETIPTEKFPSIDREKNAPVGRLLYVLSDDENPKCVRAKYTLLNGKKKLVVYSKTQVAHSYCIYQGQAHPEAEGFALKIKDGGVCVPVTGFKLDEKNNPVTLELIDRPVAFSYCTEGVTSYGEGPSGKKSAASVESAAPTTDANGQPVEQPKKKKRKKNTEEAPQ